VTACFFFGVTQLSLLIIVQRNEIVFRWQAQPNNILQDPLQADGEVFFEKLAMLRTEGLHVRTTDPNLIVKINKY
jgi:hypothetical protein